MRCQDLLRNIQLATLAGQRQLDTLLHVRQPFHQNRRITSTRQIKRQGQLAAAVMQLVVGNRTRQTCRANEDATHSLRKAAVARILHSDFPKLSLFFLQDSVLFSPFCFPQSNSLGDSSAARHSANCISSFIPQLPIRYADS